jgi:DNA polymerase-3 subunit epsilon
MSGGLLKFYTDLGFEQALFSLNRSENHKILRKVTFPNPSQVNILHLNGYEQYTISRGVYLDTETTGLSSEVDEIIQICLLPFIYASSPARNHFFIIGVYPPYIGFQEPSLPLSQEIIDLTGITMDMLIGQHLNIPYIDDIIQKTDFIVAHNAAFDRPFVHKVSMKFSEKKWACSMKDIDWKGLGFESLKLVHLAADHGFYFEPHQADKDCLAGLALLGEISADGQSYFQKLIMNAEKDSVTIRAEYAPFEAKDILKKRGYIWKDGSNGTIKGWQITVSVNSVEEERLWLSANVYHGTPKFAEKIENAFTRFLNQ